MFDSREKKLAKVQLALDGLADAQRRRDVRLVENCLEWLENALDGAPFGEEVVTRGQQALVTGPRVLAELRAAEDRAYHATLQSRLRPCAGCGSAELLATGDASVEVTIHSSIERIVFTLIVCRACGETRFVANDIAALGALKQYGKPLLLPMRAGGTAPFR